MVSNLCKNFLCIVLHQKPTVSCIKSAIFRGGAGGARAPLEFGGSQKGQSWLVEVSYYYEHPRIWKTKYKTSIQKYIWVYIPELETPQLLLP